MADGQRYLDRSVADFIPSRSAGAQNDLSLNPFFSDFIAKQSDSPPKYNDPAQRLRDIEQRMFSQGPQQGHNSRLNGAHAARGMSMLYNYAQQAPPHQHQTHGQPHQGIQTEHTGHNGNGSVMGHHQSYSSGMLSSSSPFNQGAIQNGHTNASRGGQTQPINEHWAEQLRMYKEAQQANSSMVDQGAPNYFARLKASENRGIGGPTPAVGKATADGESEDRNRPWNVDKSNRRQEWHNLDLSGQGLRNLAPPLFRYKFLQELYISSNKLSELPPAIGELRALRVLEASHNQISELPPELGMCTLPFDLGSLHQLEMLGIEGNPLNQDMKQEIVEKGTKSLITLLREQAPGKSSNTPNYMASPVAHCQWQFHFHLRLGRRYQCRMMCHQAWNESESFPGTCSVKNMQHNRHTGTRRLVP
jgi:CCR4-NOT transcription complex subunit 6